MTKLGLNTEHNIKPLNIKFSLIFGKPNELRFFLVVQNQNTRELKEKLNPALEKGDFFSISILMVEGVQKERFWIIFPKYDQSN